LDADRVVETIQRICEARGTTPTEACRDSGVGKSMVSDLKNRGSVPSVARFQRLAAHLGVSTSQLLGEESWPVPEARGPQGGEAEEAPPGYGLLSPANRQMADQLIAALLAGQGPEEEAYEAQWAAYGGGEARTRVDGPIALPEEPGVHGLPGQCRAGTGREGGAPGER